MDGVHWIAHFLSFLMSDDLVLQEQGKTKGNVKEMTRHKWHDVFYELTLFLIIFRNSRYIIQNVYFPWKA